MKHEYEAKFLAVDVVGLQTKLEDLGAVQAFPRTLLTRKIFESDVLDGAQWVRLRDEQSVREAADLLGLDYSEARFGSVDVIYKSEAGRDILAEPTLLFAEGIERSVLAAEASGQ